MKRFLTLMLALMLALCSTAMAEVTAKGELPIVTEETTLTIAMPVDPKVQDIDTNNLTLWIEEQTGINLEFIQLSSTDTASQLNLMFVSGDELPDMIWCYDMSYTMMCEFADAGYIIPLDDMIEKYGENYHTVLETSGIQNGEAQLSYDGHVFAMPVTQVSWNAMYCQYRLNYQTQFLEALGMEEPDTLEEFYNFLVGVRDEDVNGNGDPDDEIPLTGYNTYSKMVLDIIGSCFQYTNSTNFLKMNGDTVEFVANNDLFKQTVEFCKKLVDEDLLDPALYTQSKEELIALNTQEDPMVGALAVGWLVTQAYDTTSYDYFTLRSTVPLMGPDGYQATRVTYPAYVRSMFITSACENVDAAYRLMDFMLSEEAYLNGRYGQYGVHYQEHSMLEGAYELIGSQEWSNPSTNVIWDNDYMLNGATPLANSFEMPYNEEFQMFPPNHYMINVMGVETYPKYNTNEEVPYLLMDPEVQMEYEEVQTLIANYVREQAALFILGDRDLAEWENYCAEIENMGVAHYVELAQEAYNTTYGK